MKICTTLLALSAVLALSACVSTDKKKPDRPDVAPVRTSFDRIEQLTGELDTELKKKNR